jgi:putative flavoprotein involved in K+ transport
VDETPATTEWMETLIIGAGQAGLAAGYYLAQRHQPFVIVDAHARVGDQWRHRYESLHLFSPARWDGLPGMAFPAPGWSYPSGRQMGDFIEAYATRFDLPVRRSTRVDRLVRATDGTDDFIAVAGSQTFRARQVIVATGATTVPAVPAIAADLDPAIRQIHASQYHDPTQLDDGGVLVVGLGHSGADIALEVAASHPTVLVGRAHGEVPFRVLDSWRAHVFLRILGLVEDHVLTIRTPIGRRALSRSRVLAAPLLRVRSSDLARAGVERHDVRLSGTRDGKPVLGDGTVIDAATVIWATGFRPEYSWIEPAVVAPDGWPDMDRGISPVPGLYFLGVPFQFGVTSTLIHGVARDARYVVDRMMALASTRAAAGQAEPATI